MSWRNAEGRNQYNCFPLIMNFHHTGESFEQIWLQDSFKWYSNAANAYNSSSQVRCTHLIEFRQMKSTFDPSLLGQCFSAIFSTSFTSSSYPILLNQSREDELSNLACYFLIPTPETGVEENLVRAVPS